MLRITKIIYWNGTQHDEVVDVTIDASRFDALRRLLRIKSKCERVHFEYKDLSVKYCLHNGSDWRPVAV